MEKKYFRQSQIIPKNDSLSKPFYTAGASIHFLILPTYPETGIVSLEGTELTVEGSFDGSLWFSVNDFNGAPLRISTRVAQTVGHIPSGLDAAPAVLPIRQPELFTGIQMVAFRSNRIESEDRRIDIQYGD